MLGSENINLNHTLTQSESSFFTFNTSKTIAKYFGDNVLTQKPKNDDIATKNTKDSDRSEDVTFNFPKKKNSTDKIKHSSDDQTVILLNKKNKANEEEDFSYDGDVSAVTNSFSSLASAIGASGDKITKEQLIAYLQSLVSGGTDAASNPELNKEIAFIKNLLATFDTLSGGEDYITSFDGVNEPQDYTTVTQDQVTPPISILI